MPDDTHLLQTYFQDDKDIEISGLPDEKQLRTVAEYDHALFPTVLRSGLKVLCRLTLTDKGLILLGLASLRAQDIDAARKTAGMKTAFGGIAGAETARGDDKFAAELKADALSEYEKAFVALKDEGMAERFAKAPQPSFFIPRPDVLAVKPPDKVNKKFVVGTAIGDLEFMAPPEGPEAQRILSWLEQTKQGPPGDRETPRWTMARSILHFRKNGKADAAGMAAYFCGRMQGEGAMGSARALLKRAFDFFEFWSFLKGLKASGEPGAKAVVERIGGEERKGIPERIALGAGITLVGLIMGYAGLFTPTAGGTAAIFVIGLAIAGIAAVVYGLIRVIGGFMGLKRAKALLA